MSCGAGLSEASACGSARCDARVGAALRDRFSGSLIASSTIQHNIINIAYVLSKRNPFISFGPVTLGISISNY